MGKKSILWVKSYPGDYIARPAKKALVTGLQEFGQKYEVLFQDNTYWRCTVAWFSE